MLAVLRPFAMASDESSTSRHRRAIGISTALAVGVAGLSLARRLRGSRARARDTDDAQVDVRSAIENAAARFPKPEGAQPSDDIEALH